MLGLAVLAWGLLVGPLSHTVTHARGHVHSHGVPVSPEQPHGAGSLEHLFAVATNAPALPELTRVSTLLVLTQLERPTSPHVETWNSVEEPQGP